MANNKQFTAKNGFATGDNFTPPIAAPALKLDFENAKAVPPMVSVGRGSTGSYYDGFSKHLSSQNYIHYSEDFTNSYWNKASITVTADNVTAPNGLTEGTKMAASGSVSAAYMYSGLNAAEVMDQNKVWVRQIFAKAGNTNILWMEDYDNANKLAYFDLSNGTVSGAASGVTANMYGGEDGWYICTLRYTPTNGVGSWNFGPCDAAGSRTVTSGKYVYIWGAQVHQFYADDTVSFQEYQPTSGGNPVSNMQNSMVFAATNEERIDHDPITNECKGLLVETTETNTQLGSQSMGGSYWAGNSMTSINNVARAPDGTKTASLVYTTTGTQRHEFNPKFSSTSGTKYAFSVYVKAASRIRYINISLTGGSTIRGRFDLEDVTSTWIGTDAESRARYTQIQDVGNGWRRCMIVGTSDVTLSDASFYLSPGITSTSESVHTDVPRGQHVGMYLWGAQVEAGANHCSSYMGKTDGASISRSDDDLTINNTLFDNYFDPSEALTVYWKGIARYETNANAHIFNVGNGSTQNRVQFYLKDDTSAAGISLRAASTYTFSGEVGTFADGATVEACAAIEKDNCILAVKDATLTDNTVTYLHRKPVSSTIGTVQGSNATKCNTWIKKIFVWTSRLSDDQVKTLVGNFE